MKTKTEDDGENMCECRLRKELDHLFFSISLWSRSVSSSLKEKLEAGHLISDVTFLSRPIDRSIDVSCCVMIDWQADLPDINCG